MLINYLQNSKQIYNISYKQVFEKKMTFGWYNMKVVSTRKNSELYNLKAFQKNVFSKLYKISLDLEILLKLYNPENRFFKRAIRLYNS